MNKENSENTLNYDIAFKVPFVITLFTTHVAKNSV